MSEGLAQYEQTLAGYGNAADSIRSFTSTYDTDFFRDWTTKHNLAMEKLKSVQDVTGGIGGAYIAGKLGLAAYRKGKKPKNDGDEDGDGQGDEGEFGDEFGEGGSAAEGAADAAESSLSLPDGSGGGGSGDGADAEEFGDDLGEGATDATETSLGANVGEGFGADLGEGGADATETSLASAGDGLYSSMAEEVALNPIRGAPTTVSRATGEDVGDELFPDGAGNSTSSGRQQAEPEEEEEEEEPEEPPSASEPPPADVPEPPPASGGASAPEGFEPTEDGQGFTNNFTGGSDAADAGTTSTEAGTDAASTLIEGGTEAVASGLGDAALTIAAGAAEAIPFLGIFASVGIGLYELFHHPHKAPSAPPVATASSKGEMVLPSFDSVTDTPASSSAF